MRTTPLLIGALALFSILIGCGGSDDAADDAETASDGADGSAAAFCDRLDSLEAGLDVADEDVPDEGQLEALVGALRQLDPPAPIAGDFDELLDAYDVLTRIEAGDEQAAADLEEQFQEFAAAGQRVDDWTSANCGAAADGTGSD